MTLQRQASLLLFLGFYLASTVAIGQLLTSLLVDEVTHGAIPVAGQQVDEDSRHFSDGYPRYREAKKVAFSFEFRQVSAALDLRVTTREFFSAPVRVVATFIDSAVPSRSPPF